MNTAIIVTMLLPFALGGILYMYKVRNNNYITVINYLIDRPQLEQPIAKAFKHHYDCVQYVNNCVAAFAPLKVILFTSIIFTLYVVIVNLPIDGVTLYQMPSYFYVGAAFLIALPFAFLFIDPPIIPQMIRDWESVVIAFGTKYEIDALETMLNQIASEAKDNK